MAIATSANSPSWVRTYTKDDGTKYQIAYRVNTVWLQDADGKPVSSSFTTNIQCDLVAIDTNITGGGVNATWSDAATRKTGAKGAWTRRWRDDTQQEQLGYAMPDASWDDLNDRKSNFSSQVNNNIANSVARYFRSIGYGKDAGLGTLEGAMRAVSSSQGSNNQGSATDSATIGNRVSIESLADSDGIRARPRERYQSRFTYYYPVALERNYDQDKLHIQVLEHMPKETKGYKVAPRGKSMSGQTKNRKILGSVYLPVPGGVADSNNVSWGEDSMDPASLAMANAVFDGLGSKDPVEGLADQVGNIAGDVGGNSDDVKKGLQGFLTKEITGKANILTRKTGQILNPNMELLFNSPQLRPFSFAYKMSARSNEESHMIKRIIRMFKQSMAPKVSESNLFLRSPSTFRLKWMVAGNKEHSFLPKIKECALTGFNVNYTPDGNYATYENTSMVAYDVQFNFKELEPVFHNDYSALDDNKDESIGY